MSAVALLVVVLAQAPDVGEADAGAARVIVVPMPSMQAPEPIPPPLAPEPVFIVDAGTPAPRPQPAPVPAPVAVPMPAPTPAPEPTAAPPVTLAPPPPEQPPPPPLGTTVRVGIESGITSWPTGNPQDLFFFARPLLAIDSEDFSAEAGATFNLVLFDDPPVERAYDFGGFLRKADWDEPSDFGQIIRNLRIAKETSAVWMKAGPVTLKTIGNGHVINRYSNRDSADYHPAAGDGGLHIGAVRGEFFASDVFGARIFEGLAGLELGRLLANDPKWWDRFWITLELAHDEGAAGGPAFADGSRLKTPTATILQLDVSAVMYRAGAAQVQAVLGGGSRVENHPEFGAELGLTADADLDGFLLSGKLEVRKQAGGFRQGFFGPQYEISRFVGTGFSGVPLANESLPDGWSFYGELRIGSRGFIVGEVALEHYLWGRTDIDATLQAEFLGSRVVTSMRLTAIALGIAPRWAVTADLRARIFKSFYLLGAGGTVFAPQTDGTLQRGVFVSAGAGFDFETELSARPR